MTISDVLEGIRFVRKLPPFLFRPLSPRTAEDILRYRLEHREPNFLKLIRRGVYENSKSPYRRLLSHAGCEFKDFERLVSKEGLEGALRVLFRSGVYLTVNEFKGRQAVVRESMTFEVGPELFRNPLAIPHFLAYTSGSGGRRTPVPIDFEFVKQRIVNHCLALNGRGGLGWDHAVWGVPGHTDIVRILELTGSGTPPGHWFSQVDLKAPGLHPRYLWSARLMRWMSAVVGIPLPFPRHVSLEDPLPIGRWIEGSLKQGKIPHLVTFVSPALRLCQAVSISGIDISGSQFSVGGEPLTRKRLAAISEKNVAVIPRYGAIESGNFGYGCLKPRAPDDLHLYHDLHAVIQAEKDGAHSGLPFHALLVPSLLPKAPFILLNVSFGDQAEIEQRSCGCPLERFGWTTHLKWIRSFEKLTCGGMTFLDSEIIPILEEILPSRFGGSPIDYQLVERETGEGHPQLILKVSPSVGPLDIQALKEAFLERISLGPGAERVMGLQWGSAGYLSVERQFPEATETGKIRHVLQDQK